LAVGAKQVSACGWQCLVTMNSDAVPKMFPDGFNIAQHILPIRLTDTREDGGLFGIRF
jgi:hypothetical protein